MANNTPDLFSLDTVLEKYEAAIKNLSRYNRSDDPNLNGYQQRDRAQTLNTAGMLFSDAIEYAIKLHMQENWDDLATDERRLYYSFNLPEAIELLYNNNGRLSEHPHPSASIEETDIDFGFIADRTLYSNDTHHKGKDLTEENVNRICDLTAKFINRYLTPSALKTTEDFIDIPEAPHKIFEDAENFVGDGVFYILITEKGCAPTQELELLSRVDWGLVIDFDPSTFWTAAWARYMAVIILRVYLHQRIFHSQASLHRSHARRSHLYSIWPTASRENSVCHRRITGNG